MLVGGAGRVWRRARAQPGFYGLVVLSLGFGIGATTAVFAVADAALFRPLPYRQPAELVAFASTFPGPGAEQQRFLLSALNVMGIRDRTTTVARVEAMETSNLDLVGEGDPVRLAGVRTMPTLFETLGIGALVGRTLSADDVGRSAAVISEGLWSRAFGRAPDLVGRTVDLDGAAVEIVGVVEGGRAYPPGTDVWLPWRPEDQPEERMQSGSLQAIGRLRPGVTVADAQAEMTRIASELEAVYPDHNRGRGLEVEELRSPFVRQSRPMLLALLGSVAMFLALTCANVATLMMVRLRRRATDVALRHALGASRRRLLADAVGEGGVLALAGALTGMVLAAVATPPLSERLVANLPGASPTTLDPRVVGFTLAVAAGTVLVLAAGPALLGSKAAPAGLLAGARGGTGSRSDRRLQFGVVATQAALGVLLLVSAAGALGRLRTLAVSDPGFRVEGTLTVRIPLQAERWSDLEERTAFLLELRDRLARVESITAAGASNILPVGDPGASWAFSVEDRPPPDPSAFEVARGRLITPGYLRAIGIPMLAGRDFSDQDRLDAPPVVIVSRHLAETYWPGEDPVGKRLKRRTYGSPFPWMTVVGVTGDVRDDGLDQDIGPTLYMPYAQQESRLGFEMSYALRFAGSPDAAARAVRRTLSEVDARMPVVRIAFARELLDETLAGQRSSGRLLGGFALLGLALLAIGVFGVTARAVQERTRELGVRAALGAAPRRIVGDVLGGAVGPITLGALLGLGLALLAAGPIEAALGGALDPPVWALVAGPALPVLVGVLASAGPAARAARRSPVKALRDAT